MVSSASVSEISRSEFHDWIQGEVITLSKEPGPRHESVGHDDPSLEIRFVSRIHAALADLVEFLVKRSLLTFDCATGILDCVVDDIVKFAQILYRHFP
jgi:hypothetical protein